MKIGILTFHKSINYGSVLQAWALQRVLRKAGYSSEIIDYEPKEYKKIYGESNTEVFNLRKIIKNVFTFRVETRLQRMKFEEFRRMQMILSDESYNFLSSVEKAFDKYDILITGSDQIWNINLIDCDPIFFLPFIFRGKKLAYACSVNNGYLNDRFSEKWLKSWLLDYDFISIREESSVSKVALFLDGKKIFNTLDPTLLLQSDDYLSLIGDRIVKEKYIFLYNMWSKVEGIKAAKIVSEKLDLPVYSITNHMDVVHIYRYSCNMIKVDLEHTGPKDFLNFIYNADFIVTDSFHGTAFSIIFNKQFLTINSSLKKGTYKNDERLTSILNQMKLSRRFLKLEDFSKFDLSNDIDFGEVNQIRKELVEQSITLLFGAIDKI